ncbi:MAG: hypothetical protein JWP03_1849 [Phycisphaerales bacterium]|nr:hypothetical protein [Phycisphaerales bacterium]
MDLCVGKCIALSGGPLPIIAHGCPDFDLLQKWATGASPLGISIPKAVAKSARKLPGTTRHRRPVLVGGAAARVSAYRAPVAPVLSIGTTTEKGAEGLTPRSAVCHVSAATHRKVRANSCKFVHGTPLALSKTRLGRAHRAWVVQGSCGGSAGGCAAKLRRDRSCRFFEGECSQGRGGTAVAAGMRAERDPQTVAPRRAMSRGNVGAPSRHLSARAPQCSKCATGVVWCACGIAAHVDSCVPSAPRR